MGFLEELTASQVAKPGVEIVKDSIVTDAFGYFQSGKAGQKEEQNRKTTAEAQEYLHQEEVKTPKYKLK